MQIGSLFAASKESSAHINFKNEIIKAKENDTILTLKELAPVRLLKNSFYQKIFDAYQNRVSTEDLKTLLGRARAKKGMFEGDLIEGELEIGQVSAQINKIKTVNEIMEELTEGFKRVKNNLNNFDF